MYLSDQPNAPLELQIDWRHQRKGEHLVQWYKADSVLVSTVTGYVADALGRGDAAITIATESHRDGIEARLEAAGVDVFCMRRNGRYIALDAEETLGRFMVGSSPNAELFFEVIGGVISKASNSWSGIRAFGEMVGVLWEQKNYEGAIEVEQLWHRLRQQYSFPLFCAYPKTSLQDETEIESFARVCDEHSVVIL